MAETPSECPTWSEDPTAVEEPITPDGEDGIEEEIPKSSTRTHALPVQTAHPLLALAHRLF